MDSLALLSIDSSTDNASLAIARDGKVLAEIAWHSRQNHSVELMPNIERLLKQTNTDIKSIGCIIVARGPGSFNGLRVGISTAKGLAFGLGVPIIGIGTLEAAAYQYAEKGLPICSIMGAGRDEIATALYRLSADKWQQVIAEHITTVDSLCEKIKSKTIFCGELTPFIIETLKLKLGRKAIISPPSAGPCRATFLAELGLKRLQADVCDKPSTLQPIYLRRPQITQPKNRNWVASQTGSAECDNI